MSTQQSALSTQPKRKKLTIRKLPRPPVTDKSNILLVLGALLIIAGVSLWIRPAAGLIAAGVFLILGAVATAQLKKSPVASSQLPEKK